ncbi:MAG: hypothetical protein JW982_02095 [Spirochaetes bacterium]|nr:hypothetical protein [Spirochaetota bacterium]
MKKLVLFLLIFAVSCGTTENIKVISVKPSYKGQIENAKWNSSFSVEISSQEKINLLIYFPSKFEIGRPLKTLIVLHDQNQDNREWSRNSRIVKFAEQYNVVLVCPQMKNSIYSRAYFPETSAKWASVPGAVFIGENLVAYLRETLGLAAARNLTSVIGIGGGAHGAVRCGELYPDKIGGIAALSGFYDFLVMTRDKRISSVYGDFKNFKDRWEAENILSQADRLADSRMIIIHGGKDAYFPITHARMLAIKIRSLEKSNPGKYRNKYVEKASGRHDWAFWNSQLETVFEFLYTEI